MNTKKTLIGVFVVVLGLGLSSFKDDDRNFQIAKNLDIFNSIFKELDLFYVDTINPEKMIQNGVNGMLALTEPYTEYYPEEGVSSLKEMITGKYGGIGAAIRYYKKKDRRSCFYRRPACRTPSGAFRQSRSPSTREN